MLFSHSQALFAEIQMPVLATSMGAVLTLFVKTCGFRYQWCRGPQAHHTHKNPVPRLGGIAVYLAIVLAIAALTYALGLRTALPALAIVAAVVPVLLVGFYDDIRFATPKSKVLAQLAGAALLLAAHRYLFGGVSLYELLWMPVWLVVTTNSFNLVDGVDGLASSTAVVMALALAAIHLVAGNIAFAFLALFTAAACLGFLPFNIFGHRIFLGDSGSLSIGFILGALAIEVPRGDSSIPWVAIAMFGYPLSETVLTIVRRTLKGRNPFRPDREHLHHKLRHARLSNLRAVAVLCFVNAAFAAIGVMLALGASRWISVAGIVVLFLATAKSFGYLRARNLAKLRRRLGASRPEPLPDIAGYLPFK